MYGALFVARIRNTHPTPRMITANQLKAARALLALDQRQIAAMSGLSVPTIQRMEASEGVVRGNVESLMKLVAALEGAGIELIGPGGASTSGGRGVRLKENAAHIKPAARAKATRRSVATGKAIRRGGSAHKR